MYETIAIAIEKLLHYGISRALISPADQIYVRNGLLDLLQLSDWTTPKEDIAFQPDDSIDDVLKILTNAACEKNLLEDTAASRERFETRMMGYLTPMPHEIIAKFQSAYTDSPQAATDWYYAFSKNTNYVRTGAITKNLCWKYHGTFGTLDITINLLKSEKDPRDIAAAKLLKQTSYPLCQLCLENTGFAGTATHPARQNLRPVPVEIHGNPWYLQYSPYGYYPEHCILFHGTHTPMKIDDAVFGKLLDAIAFLPHYFMGSNADLPIVGGSILSHEHFQGGHYSFAMEQAEIVQTFSLPQTPSVQAGVVRWPLSVIRLRSDNRHELEQACCQILHAWRGYSDPSVEILSETNGTPHNTITPIARMRGTQYEIDLVLRNNRTTKERPLGRFNPNPKLHHIKKENIGLIEVMGLAVLPGRLAKELPEMAQVLMHNDTFAPEKYPQLEAHLPWLEEIYNQYQGKTFSEAEAMETVKLEIGRVFEAVLLDAGVFAQDDMGKAAFKRFTQTVTSESENLTT